MYDATKRSKQTMMAKAVKNGVLINGFNEFSDAGATILLIGPILLARTWNGKSNCLPNQKRGEGSQLKQTGCQQAPKMGNGSKLN